MYTMQNLCLLSSMSNKKRKMGEFELKRRVEIMFVFHYMRGGKVSHY